MVRALFANRFTIELDDEAAALAAFEAHYAAVRATVPADRLLEWTVADGWGPLCAALDVPVPDDPFPASTPATTGRPPRIPTSSQTSSAAGAVRSSAA